MCKRSILSLLLISLFSCQNEFSTDTKNYDSENSKIASSKIITIARPKIQLLIF